MAVNLDPSLLANPANWPPLLWLALAVALGVGYGLGTLLSSRGQSAARVRELERELDTTREEFESYREQVSGHFTDTSKHLRDLALQYKTVYEHLADGARALCPDSAMPIEASGLARDLLPSSVRSDDGLETDEPGLAPEAEELASEAPALESDPFETTDTGGRGATADPEAELPANTTRHGADQDAETHRSPSA